MKTKLIILGATGSLLLFSCTTDRSDDEAIQPTPTAKVEVKKLKIINKEEQATSKEADSIKAPIPPAASTTTDGNTIQPENPDPVVDPTKPDKPW